ncbi:hypothetical protein [Nocardiopsis synnemataformans]|uniref:hypothetical protein n=1 Tax=Nocardiopsis synnemataformans TaxID=61305 RepID=UPI003EBB0872
MVTSIVRTVVPYAVGLIVSLAASIGLDLPAEATTEVLTAVTTFVVGTVYYWVARFFEEHISPRVGGLMLLSRRRPEYTKAA